VATWTGWIAAALLLLAAAVPLGHRLIHGRRAAPGSRTQGWHVVLGLTAALAALAHATTILPALGDPAAVRGATTALLPGVLAVFLLVAHVGLGLRLRQPQLRDRVRLRRAHLIVAATIACAVAVHVVALR
jgi:formate-dependent nitrite reductase membrane component NrfD